MRERSTIRTVVLFLACSACSSAPVPPLLVTAAGHDKSCTVRVDGVEMKPDELDASRMRKLRKAHHRQMVVHTDRNTPYRCVGAVIIELQQAGFRLGSLTVEDVAIVPR